MESQNKNRPITDHDWTIHSINIHGLFFERWCRNVLESRKRWNRIISNYPVAYASKHSVKESALDLRAYTQVSAIRTTLLIECKKNNPDFIEWIFFPPHQKRNKGINFSALESVPTDSQNWNTLPTLREFYFDIPIADDARETRGQYQRIANEKRDKTKTSNSAISEAAYQVALATQAIRIEEANFSQNESAAKTAWYLPWSLQIFLPTIVTSARLFTCDFNPSDVDPTSGEIPFEKAKLNEQPYLIYQYTLPPHLQNIPEALATSLTLKDIETYLRMSIFVVQSKEFEAFLIDVAEALDAHI
jgi:hypothetical protein